MTEGYDLQGTIRSIDRIVGAAIGDLAAPGAAEIDAAEADIAAAKKLLAGFGGVATTASIEPLPLADADRPAFEDSQTADTGLDGDRFEPYPHDYDR
jgi:hypothetical protein